VTITLGTFASGTLKTGVVAVAQKYTPAAGLTDLAGNALPTTQITDGAVSRF